MENGMKYDSNVMDETMAEFKKAKDDEIAK